MASATAESSSSEANAEAAADARGRRPVWNVPPNGAIEVGHVKDTVLWPALSESVRASPKSSSSESLKSVSDCSAFASASAPPGPLLFSPSRQANSPQNPITIQNPMHPARQRSMRGGNGSSSGTSGSSSGGTTPANGGFGLTLPPPVLVEIAQSATERQAVPEPSPRGSRTAGLAPQAHGVGDQPWGYGGNRRGNNGGGSHHNHVNRRDQQLNHHRNAYLHHSHQRGGGVRLYPRQPPSVISAPFAGPPRTVRPFVGNAMGFPDVHPLYFITSQPSPESFGVMPYVPHPVPPTFFPAMDPQRAQLLKQIDYYFSYENLSKDMYLRQNMDDQGWVPISLIANFNRVKQLTNSIQYIVDTVKYSTVVEVQFELEQENKIRRRNDWMTWLIHSSNHLGSTSSGQSVTSDYDAVATRLQNMSLLDGSTTNHYGMRGQICADTVLTRSASGNLNNPFQVVGDPSRYESGQFTGFNDSDRLRSSRSLSRSDTL